MSLRGSPEEAEVRCYSQWEQTLMMTAPGNTSVWALLEVAILAPTQQPADSSTVGCLRTKPPGWKQSHPSAYKLSKVLLTQQSPINTPLDILLLTRGTKSHSTYQWEVTSPTYQEAYTSPWTNFIHQERNTRTKKNYDTVAWGLGAANIESQTKSDGRETCSR